MFPEDMPSALSPIWDIEHQIDFILEVVIPNGPAYKSNLEETETSKVGGRVDE